MMDHRRAVRRVDYKPPDAVVATMLRSSPAASIPPGIAPPVEVHPQQLDIVNRLHLLASSVPKRCPVTVIAEELLALLNGFWQESRRADQAEARLQGLPRPGAANPQSSIPN